MSTPDPRRGDEPGDPDVIPGQPTPAPAKAPSDPEHSDKEAKQSLA
jgi:hypothetical protein